jgi:two-component system, sensor histidine kinase
MGAMTTGAQDERFVAPTAEVAHELRSPLGGVEAMARLLAGTALSDEQRRLVDGLCAAAAHLRAVADDILDEAATASGAAPAIVERPLDIAAFLSPVAVAAAARAKAKALDFALHVDDRLSSPLLADARRIRQMLENLIDNAVKATESGAIALEVTLIDRRGGFDGLRFAVLDSGPGLPAEAADRLFRSYGKLDDRGSGTGLGLSLVRKLARSMGGEAGCDSPRADGRLGSTFWFTLRLKQAAGPHVQDAATPAEAPGRPPACRVLVVDDNHANRLIMGAVLEHFGYRMAEAASAEEALAMLSCGGFAAVLLDHTLPGMTGLEALKRIRAMPEPLASLPVVPVTGRVSGADRAAFMAAGADGFVEKPVTAKAVREALAEALAARLGRVA